MAKLRNTILSGIYRDVVEFNANNAPGVKHSTYARSGDLLMHKTMQLNTQLSSIRNRRFSIDENLVEKIQPAKLLVERPGDPTKDLLVHTSMDLADFDPNNFSSKAVIDSAKETVREAKGRLKQKRRLVSELQKKGISGIGDDASGYLNTSQHWDAIKSSSEYKSDAKFASRVQRLHNVWERGSTQGGHGTVGERLAVSHWDKSAPRIKDLVSQDEYTSYQNWIKVKKVYDDVARKTVDQQGRLAIRDINSNTIAGHIPYYYNPTAGAQGIKISQHEELLSKTVIYRGIDGRFKKSGFLGMQDNMLSALSSGYVYNAKTGSFMDMSTLSTSELVEKYTQSLDDIKSSLMWSQGTGLKKAANFTGKGMYGAMIENTAIVPAIQHILSNDQEMQAFGTKVNQGANILHPLARPGSAARMAVEDIAAQIKADTGIDIHLTAAKAGRLEAAGEVSINHPDRYIPGGSINKNMTTLIQQGALADLDASGLNAIADMPERAGIPRAPATRIHGAKAVADSANLRFFIPVDDPGSIFGGVTEDVLIDDKIVENLRRIDPDTGQLRRISEGTGLFIGADKYGQTSTKAKLGVVSNSLYGKEHRIDGVVMAQAKNPAQILAIQDSLIAEYLKRKYATKGGNSITKVGLRIARTYASSTGRTYEASTNSFQIRSKPIPRDNNVYNTAFNNALSSMGLNQSDFMTKLTINGKETVSGYVANLPLTVRAEDALSTLRYMKSGAIRGGSTNWKDVFQARGWKVNQNSIQAHRLMGRNKLADVFQGVLNTHIAKNNLAPIYSMFGKKVEGFSPDSMTREAFLNRYSGDIAKINSFYANSHSSYKATGILTKEILDTDLYKNFFGVGIASKGLSIDVGGKSIYLAPFLRPGKTSVGSKDQEFKNLFSLISGHGFQTGDISKIDQAYSRYAESFQEMVFGKNGLGIQSLEASIGGRRYGVVKGLSTSVGAFDDAAMAASGYMVNQMNIGGLGIENNVLYQAGRAQETLSNMGADKSVVQNAAKLALGASQGEEAITFLDAKYLDDISPEARALYKAQGYLYGISQGFPVKTASNITPTKFMFADDIGEKALVPNALLMMMERDTDFDKIAQLFGGYNDDLNAALADAYSNPMDRLLYKASHHRNSIIMQNQTSSILSLPSMGDIKDIGSWEELAKGAGKNLIGLVTAEMETYDPIVRGRFMEKLLADGVSPQDAALRAVTQEAFILGLVPQSQIAYKRGASQAGIISGALKTKGGIAAALQDPNSSLIDTTVDVLSELSRLGAGFLPGDTETSNLMTTFADGTLDAKRAYAKKILEDSAMVSDLYFEHSGADSDVRFADKIGRELKHDIVDRRYEAIDRAAQLGLGLQPGQAVKVDGEAIKGNMGTLELINEALSESAEAAGDGPVARRLTKGNLAMAAVGVAGGLFLLSQLKGKQKEQELTQEDAESAMSWQGNSGPAMKGHAMRFNNAQPAMLAIPESAVYNKASLRSAPSTISYSGGGAQSWSDKSRTTVYNRVPSGAEWGDVADRHRSSMWA